MSLLKTIDPNPSFEPKHRTAEPDRLIAGSPAFKTWLQDTAKEGRVNTGVFEATRARRTPSKAKRLSSAILSMA